MLDTVASLEEICISPFAGPLPESLRWLDNRGGITGILPPAAHAATVAECTGVEASATAVKASAAAAAERADVEASADAADVEASATAAVVRAAVEACATATARAERASVEASAATARLAAFEASVADAAERAAVEASAADDAERAAADAGATTAAAGGTAVFTMGGRRPSRRGARGGRRAKSRSCFPTRPYALGTSCLRITATGCAGREGGPRA